MKLISKEEAIECLYNHGIEIHFEALNNYWQYSTDFDAKYTCYYRLNGCMITKAILDEHIYFLIHQVSKNADICAAWKYILQHEKTDDVEQSIVLFACAPLPEEILAISDFECKFARKGEQYEDSDIRKMTKEDKDIIKETCEGSCNNDNDFGRDEANVFYSYFDYEDLPELLGIFCKNKLAGLVTVDMFKKSNIAIVSDIFVHKDYRRLGLGKRLVRAALALYPDAKYIYSANKQNDASVELAKSAGFKFVGATELWVSAE